MLNSPWKKITSCINNVNDTFSVSFTVWDQKSCGLSALKALGRSLRCLILG